MGRDMRILLVEDEPKVSALVKRGLTAERYAVDVTADGREGLEYTEAYPYDLILLDLMLPSMSGEEVLQRIRTDQSVRADPGAHRARFRGRQSEAVRHRR